MNSTEFAAARPASKLFDQLGTLPSRIEGRLKLGLYKTAERYGLRRDLDLPLEKPSAKIPISIRPMRPADLDVLFPADIDPAEREEAAPRRAFAARHMAGGFVAVDERSDTPCYMQWLLGAADNDFLKSLNCFPELLPDEALLENAYTPPAYRGMGIMSAAMAAIAERAADFGARYVITFVMTDNIASLKGCQRAGFFPDLLHSQIRAGFGTYKRDSFTKLDSNDPVRQRRF